VAAAIDRRGYDMKAKKSPRVYAGCMLVLALGASCGGDVEKGPVEGAAGGADAGVDGAAGDAPVDSTDAAVEPPSDCAQRLRAFDATCETDVDCALVVLYSCFSFESSPAIGIRRDELDAFAALAAECNLPNPDAGSCPPGEGRGWAHIVTDHDDQVDAQSPGEAVVQCLSGSCQTLRTSCGPELCGNGTIDACLVTNGTYGPMFTKVDAVGGATIEPCDGAELAGATCQTLGYGSGTLSCVPDSCLLTSTECDACEELDNRLLACKSAIKSPALSLTLAATETEIAAAWFGDSASGHRLHFTRFSPDLVELSDEETPIITPGSSGGTVSVAPYSAGWAVALDGEIPDTLEIHGFDGGGAYMGLAQRIEQAHSPSLIARPPEPPMLVYIQVDPDPFVSPVSVSSVLSADLTAGSIPLLLAPNNGPPVPVAVFTGTAFLFADTIDSTQRTWRVERDGLWFGQMNDIGPGTDGDYERLALTSSAPVLLYHAAASAMTYLVHLDEQGAPTSTTPLPNIFPGFGAVLGFESDVLLTTTQTGLELTRISASGQTVWQARIASAPVGIAQPQVVQCGSDIVVGWVARERLGLAKIQP